MLVACRRWVIRAALTAGVLLLGAPAAGALSRGQQLYVLHCMGCHLPRGEGVEGRVPRMADFVGYFTHIPEGRAYLVQVPGVSQSALSDAEIAEVLNWVLETQSAKQLPPDFTPYTEEEVARHRSQPLLDVTQVREALLERLRRIGVLP